MKQMHIIKEQSRVDLLIEEYSGNQVRILMGGKTKAAIRKNWKALRDLCDRAIELDIDDINLPEK